MKKQKYWALCYMLTFISLTINAQTIPTVSLKYTGEQIRALYKEHKKSRSHDVVAPTNLIEKFDKDFPKARDVDWEKSAILYEVEFEIGWFNSTDYKAFYDMEGNLVLYKQEISTRDLPAIVKNAVLSKYPNFRIDDTEQIVAGKDALYRVSLEKGDTDLKILLGHDGTIINEYFD